MDRPGAGGGTGPVNGIRTRGSVLCLRQDIICSIFMSCLEIAAQVLRSMPRASTPQLSCWNRGLLRLRRPACWPGGWAARSGRRAATSARQRHRAGFRSPMRARCSPSAAGPARGGGPGACPRVRAHGLVGGGAGAEGVPRPRSRGPSAPVRELPVDMVPVFSRHAAAEMSVAYGILVPQRRARTAAGAPEGGSGDGDGDLCAGLQRPAGEGRDDRLPAVRAARARRDQPA